MPRRTGSLHLRGPFSHVAAAPLIAAFAAGLLASTWATLSRAEQTFVETAVYVADPNAKDSGVRAVSYSTGKAGHKLKWLPYRPSEATAISSRADSASKERLAQYTSPVRPGATPARTINPFDDPFGDGERASGPSRPKITLQDHVLESQKPKPAVPGSLPPITVEDEDLRTARSGLVQPAQPEKEKDKLREALAAAPELLDEPCSAVGLKPITEITHDISATGDMFPDDCTFEDMPEDQRKLPDRMQEGWAPMTFTWKASALCHKPLYFEDVHLERYGHSCGPYLQPVVSGAHFFLTVPILPYKMGLYPPHECIYSLGYYRPGSCAPYMLDPLPLSIRAGLAEAGVWTGMVFLIP